MNHGPTKGRASPIVVQLTADGLLRSPLMRAKEVELLKSISELLPAAARASVQSVVEGGGDFSGPAFETAEVRVLIEELTQLYDSALQTEIAAQHVASAEREKNRVYVIIALVPGQYLRGKGVALLRGPDNDGRPVVLLNETTATDLDARIGVAAAVVAVRAHPAAPLSPTIETIDPNIFDKENLRRGEVIDELRTEVVARELPGVGCVRWTLIASA